MRRIFSGARLLASRVEARWYALALFLLANACGEISVDPSRDAASTHQELPDGGGASTRSMCPLSMPSVGGICTGELTCEFGNDPRVSCDTLLTCSAGAWQTAQPPSATGCSTMNPASCPASFADATSMESCAMGVSCYYPEARCYCGSTVPGEPLRWLCDTGTNTTPGASAGQPCPSPRPRIGAVCAEAGEVCDYGYCQDDDVALLCAGGIWTVTPASTNGCPL